MAETQPNEESSDRNRRQYERVKVSKPVKLEATLRGRFIDIMRLEMSGVTVDMSEGGVLANVDQSISPGVRCRVELPGEDGADPKTVWGRVRRTSSGSNGYMVALEFDEPIETAELPDGFDLGDAESAMVKLAEGNGARKGGAEIVKAAEEAASAPAEKRKP